MKHYDAVVAGYTCIDLIPDFRKNNRIENISDFFVPGSLIEIEGMDFILGGVVPNTGLAMKKFGKKVFLNGLIGTDPLGKVAEAQFKRYNVSEEMVKTGEADTAFSIVLAPPGFDRLFLESPGCNRIFDLKHIDFEAVKKSKLFHFGYPPLLRQFYINQGEQLVQLFSEVKKMEVVTSLDFSLPDPGSESGKIDWLRIMQSVLPHVDIFAPSVEEVVRIMKPEQYSLIQSSLTENADIIDAIPEDFIYETGREIIDSGVKILMIKAGARGIYLFTGDTSSVGERLGFDSDTGWSNQKIFCKAYHAAPDKIIHASGAGDTAIAAFLSAVLNGEKPENALKYAAMAGRNNLYCNNLFVDLKTWQEISKEIDSEQNKITYL